MIMLNVIALRYFVETVRLNGFTAAAQSLGVSQSTVSKMVRSLEDQIGETLIIRNGKPLLLSDVGRVLYEKGSDVLTALARLEQEVHEVQALSQGRVNIGIPPMINLLFTQVMKDFRERYPTISLQIYEYPGPAIEQMVATNELDVGFSIAPVDQLLPLEHQVVARHDVYAIALPEFLARNKDSIALAQVVQKPLLLLNDDFGLTRLLRQRFAQEQLQPRIYAQSSQWDWLISMAQAGLGVALLPEPFCSRLPTELVYKVIEEKEPLSWEVTLLWNGRYLSQAARAWLECCQTQLGGEWLLASVDNDE